MRPRSKRHYDANKPYYRARNKKKAAELGAWLRAYKEAHPVCVDCKLPHPYWRLDFDHLRDKAFEVGQGVRWSMRKLLAEIAKCELVCANCHRDRTHQRRTSALGKA